MNSGKFFSLLNEIKQKSASEIKKQLIELKLKRKEEQEKESEERKQLKNEMVIHKKITKIRNQFIQAKRKHNIQEYFERQKKNAEEILLQNQKDVKDLENLEKTLIIKYTEANLKEQNFINILKKSIILKNAKKQTLSHTIDKCENKEIKSNFKESNELIEKNDENEK